MARKKVTLAWIPNDSIRRTTLQKRRKGLMKKVSELATLCDVKACAIVFTPKDPKDPKEPKEPEPEVWPSTPDAAQVLSCFHNLPETERGKKMMNQEGFLRHRVDKLQEQFQRQQREVREMETTVLMHDGLAGRGLYPAGIADISSLLWMLDMRIKKVQQRMDLAVATTEVPMESAATMKPEGTMIAREMHTIDVAVEAIQRQNWYTDLINPSENFGMNPNENLVFCEELIQPYVDNGSAWLDAFFPLK